jgi:SOS-response transcriptional repressor LexA
LPGVEHIYIPQVEIDDELYQVYSLRNSAIVSMTGGKSTYVIKIIGDSMDAYPILPGDYVLVNTGLAYSPGDIVVTEVIDETDDASHNIKLLKSIDKHEIVLEYMSHNPDYHGKRLIIQNNKKNFTKILGVAVARFSRSEAEEAPIHNE